MKHRLVRTWVLVGTLVFGGALLLVGPPAASSSGGDGASSLQLLIAAVPSSEEASVWHLGVRVYDRQESTLVSEPIISTRDGEEATFYLSDPRGGSLRLVVTLDHVE